MTSLGISSIASLSISVPEILEASDKSISTISQIATSQLAMAVFLTSIITPIIVRKYMKKNQKD